MAHGSTRVPEERLFVERGRDDLPSILPGIELSHGRALWVLTELGYRGASSQSTFREYIKSLRKLGIPFERGEIASSRGAGAIYSYCHLMELALTLTLRVYHVVPDSLLNEIVQRRERLNRYYRYAYAHRQSGRGAPVIIQMKGVEPIGMRGVFLDLQINFSGGKLVSFGPLKALSPAEALAIFAERDLAARALLPFNLSLLAERVVGAALRAPIIRRGPRPGKPGR